MRFSVVNELGVEELVAPVDHQTGNLTLVALDFLTNPYFPFEPGGCTRARRISNNLRHTFLLPGRLSLFQGDLFAHIANPFTLVRFWRTHFSQPRSRDS